jgi:hypothetical protein
MRKRGWSGWSGRFLHFGEDLPHRILGNIVVGDFATEFAPQLVGDFACDQTVTQLKAVHQPGVDLGSLGEGHVGHQRWVAHNIYVADLVIEDEVLGGEPAKPECLAVGQRAEDISVGF